MQPTHPSHRPQPGGGGVFGAACDSSVPFVSVRPLLVIEQESRLEGLGLLGKRLEAAGIPYRRFRVWDRSLSEIDLGDSSGIVPLGGNAHAFEEERHPYVRHERELLEEAVASGLPLLGICLGAQILARALGAEVRTTCWHEYGCQEVVPTQAAADDPLFGHLDGPVGVYQWHTDEFELPPRASRLMTGSLFPNQAYRRGDAWGVQSHPEVDYETFRVWLSRHDGICRRLGIDEDALRAAVRSGAARDLAWRSELFDRFAALVAKREGASARVGAPPALGSLPASG